MNLTLSSTTRGALAMYMQQQAGMNNVSPAALAQRFNVQPAVQQRMENAIQLSDELLQRINVIGVTDQKGEKVLIGINGPSAGVNTSTSERREPASLHELTPVRLRANQLRHVHQLRATGRVVRTPGFSGTGQRADCPPCRP